MRRVPILYGVFLLLAGFMLGRAIPMPAPYVAAQDSFKAPAAVFVSDDEPFGPPPPPFARHVAQAAPRRANATTTPSEFDPFSPAAREERAAPAAFIPTPIAVQSEQEEKYLNAALKVFRGIGENERLAAVEQMIGRMEEQDAAAELLRLRTELQQLSEKYPKTGAAKKALEAIQTLPVVDVPESGTPASEAPTALPRPLENDSIFKPDTEVE